MKPRLLKLSAALTRTEVLRLEGDRPAPNHFDTLVTYPADAYDIDTGRLIFRFRKRVLGRATVRVAGKVFGDINARMKPSFARKSAAGRIDLGRVRAVRPDVVAVELSEHDKFAAHFVLASGKRLADPMSNPVSSYMAGYNYNRYKKLGAPTGFSARFPDEWSKALPFFESIGRCFDTIMPDASKHMHEWCRAHNVAPGLTIGRTCLSTVAINVNYDSCFHFDRGDLPTGYSTLTALAVGGTYTGGYLVLPQYRVAVDVQDGDLFCNQSHIDLHGNTAVTPSVAGAKRVSFVTYLKKRLMHAVNKAAPPEL